MIIGHLQFQGREKRGNIYEKTDDLLEAYLDDDGNIDEVIDGFLSSLKHFLKTGNKI